MKTYDELSTKVIAEFGSDTNRPNRQTRALLCACYGKPTVNQRAVLSWVLNKMIEKGYLERISHGVYTLTAKGKECLK